MEIPIQDYQPPVKKHKYYSKNKGAAEQDYTRGEEWILGVVLLSVVLGRGLMFFRWLFFYLMVMGHFYLFQNKWSKKFCKKEKI